MVEENEQSKPVESGAASSSVGVPVAIVLAGALIAAALYFGGSGVKSNNVNQAAKQAGNAPVAAKDDSQVAGAAVGDFRPVDDTDHVRGARNAKVTIIEYSDIQCPFCKRFHETMQQVMAAYPNKVRWVYRHFPLEQLHQNAKVAALASECANEQGKFWEALDYMFAHTETGDELAESKLPAMMQKAGVPNISQFTNCLTTKKFESKVASDAQDAAAAGGRCTPYSVLVGPNGEKEVISGAQPLEAVKAMVDKYL